MYIDADTIIKAGAVIGAVLSILAIVKMVVSWIGKREATSKGLDELKKQHNGDVQGIREELCVLTYAMLAALDGLKQLNCNGEVTIAHDKLSKHLNEQAHNS